MSAHRTSKWLLSHNLYQKESNILSPERGLININNKAYTISVTSGKGGVGKTSISLKLSKLLADQGYRVLLIDCDYNLSNSAVKLGLPLNDNFFSLLTMQKTFSECLYKSGNFHLFSGSNGNVELFDREFLLDRLIMDILVEQENKYDFILLDCPAGISREALTLNAYSDFRFIIITPDKSSITDSYSLIKILKNKYGINNNHLLVNKISSGKQYRKMVKTMSETVENFLNSRLHILGGINKDNRAVDLFDRILLGDEQSEIHENFVKVLKTFVDENLSNSRNVRMDQSGLAANLDGPEQDVHKIVS